MREDPIARENLIACFRRLRSLGYDRRTAVRLARWACNPDQPVEIQ